MRIAILQPADAGSESPYVALDPKRDPARHGPDHVWTTIPIRKAVASREISAAAAAGYDVFVNLCDGAEDEDRPGVDVVRALERHGAAFTGAGSAFFDPSRVAMKMAAQSCGVAFPAFVLATHPSDSAIAARELRFPLLVKHPHGYSSVGLTAASRVTDEASLNREVSRTIDAYGAALVEEFIEGRELTVLVAEPRDGESVPWVLTPVEFLFPPGESFKHFDLKWRDYQSMATVPVTDADLDRRAREAAANVFEALGGTGYGRCDFRIDPSGELYLLEINPNAAVFYPEGQFGSADVILSHDPAGPRGFLEHLLAIAVRRRGRQRQPWRIEYRRVSGFGLVAAAAIPAGHLAVRYEEEPHVLASRGHIDRNWKGLKRGWYERYAWPMTGEVQVLWQNDPEAWRPLNHSCDPNTWLEGLNLVARRDIASGEPLTADYATFCGPGTAPFECSCGARACRRVVRGTDYLLPEMRKRFGTHVSDFVSAAWEKADPDWSPPHEVLPNGVGLGLVARRGWTAGEAICALTWAQRQTRPTRWTVQCGDDEQAEPMPFELRYINHGCDPNVQFDIAAGVLRALRDIAPQDELRFFYPATEWAMVEPFTCNCGAESCLGTIEGASRLPREVLARYVLSPVIQRHLTRAVA